MLRDSLYHKGDKVKLLFDETATVVRVENLLWFYCYYVRIRKATFNKTNQIIDCLEKDILGFDINKK